MEVKAKKQGNALVVLGKKELQVYLSKFEEGTEFLLDIVTLQDAMLNTRNNKQNALYWRWCELVAKELGWDSKDAVHEDFKQRFNSGESTTDLSKEDFSIYLMKVDAFVSTELQISLPYDN